MKLFFRLVLLAAFISLGVWLYMVFFPVPEKIIRAHLRDVAVYASFQPNEGALARVSNVGNLSGYFAPDAKIHLDTTETGEHSFTGRDGIISAANAVRSVLNSLTVKFADINITMGADKESANVELTARVEARGQNDFIISAVRFSFKKIDGEWLIVRVETIKVLS